MIYKTFWVVIYTLLSTAALLATLIIIDIVVHDKDTMNYFSPLLFRTASAAKPKISVKPVDFKSKGKVSILCFGDSWTSGNGYGLDYQIGKLNLRKKVRVYTYDEWGTEASYFAQDKNLKKIETAIQRTDADYLVLSLGGNDLKNLFWKNKIKGKYFKLPSYHYIQIKQDLTKVLNYIFELKPEIRVVMYGYDFPGNLKEYIGGLDILNDSKHGLVTKGYDWIGVRFINYYFKRIGNLIEEVTKEFKEKGYEMEYIPLWGTLQTELKKEEEKETEEDVETEETSIKGWLKYDLNLSSHNEYMADAAHPNEKGYKLLMSKLYNYYFKPEFKKIGVFETQKQ